MVTAITWFIGIATFTAICIISLRRWRYSVDILLAALPFSGVPIVLLYSAPMPVSPVLFKDILLVLPVYLVFFLFHRRQSRLPLIPAAFRVNLIVFAAAVCIYVFAPGVSNWSVAAIGAKVWLFYVPMLFIAFEYVRNTSDLRRLLKIQAVIGWIPCLIGIAEWMSSVAFGYRQTMTMLYGDAASSVTQEFASFTAGGTIYRIPSTFSFSTQYFGYTLVLVVTAYVLGRLEADKKRQWFAQATLCLAIVASLLSGIRASFVFIPLLLVTIYMFDRRLAGTAVVALVLPLLMGGTLLLGRLDPSATFSLVQQLFGTYAENTAYGMLEQALTTTPMGAGIGMNTGAARYALSGTESFLPLESYYAKAVREMGVLGLILIVALFVICMATGLSIHRRLTDKGLRGCAAAITAFIFIMALNSFKGWQMDLDPINVYFWVFTGILFKLPYVELRVSDSRPMLFRGLGRRSFGGSKRYTLTGGVAGAVVNAD
jgi:hypothetical protein